MMQPVDLSRSIRKRSPTRDEVIAKAQQTVTPIYCDRVLIGNWVEDRSQHEKIPKDESVEKKIDYEKMKPQRRHSERNLNKIRGHAGDILNILTHDSHDGRGNYATTNDLVFNHLPKSLCGPIQRHYMNAPHQYVPQPDLMPCYGNKTEWGLRAVKKYEWACTDVSDYNTSLFEDTFVAPRPSQYLQPGERKGRSSRFTKSFLHKMQKPRPKSE